jgi:hypothetical protein
MASLTFEEYPQRYARIGGALYLAIILLGAFAEGFVANKLVVSGDAMATAHNILSSPGLWQLSVAGDLIVVLCAVPLLWIKKLSAELTLLTEEQARYIGVQHAGPYKTDQYRY